MAMPVEPARPSPPPSPPPPPRSRAAFYVAGAGLAALHFFASCVAVFGAGSGGGLPWKIAAGVLTFPLSLVPDKWLPENGAPGWVPWVALSLAWGFGVAGVARWVNRRRAA